MDPLSKPDVQELRRMDPRADASMATSAQRLAFLGHALAGQLVEVESYATRTFLEMKKAAAGKAKDSNGEKKRIRPEPVWVIPELLHAESLANLRPGFQTVMKQTF
eukprot:jgi/Pico_ML_1/53407/g3962.t1